MEATHYGRYFLKQKIGQGGMGSVYFANDPRFGRDVVFKLLPPALLHDPAFHQRFTKEAQLITRLAERTQTMTIIGTRRYLAPEPAHAKALDVHTDAYQMGVVS